MIVPGFNKTHIPPASCVPVIASFLCFCPPRRWRIASHHALCKTAHFLLIANFSFLFFSFKLNNRCWTFFFNITYFLYSLLLCPKSFTKFLSFSSIVGPGADPCGGNDWGVRRTREISGRSLCCIALLTYCVFKRKGRTLIVSLCPFNQVFSYERLGNTIN